MKNYKVAVIWKETGVLIQKEQTLERAVRNIKGKIAMEDEAPSPGNFVEGSVVVDEEATKLLNKTTKKEKAVEEEAVEQETE